VPKQEYQINIALQSPPDSLWTGFSNSRQPQTTSATNNVNYLLGKKRKGRAICVSFDLAVAQPQKLRFGDCGDGADRIEDRG
jgi:hypothetical protein